MDQTHCEFRRNLKIQYIEHFDLRKKINQKTCLKVLSELSWKPDLLITKI